MKAQLNVRIGPGLHGKIRADARRNNKPVDGVVSVILKDFYSAWTPEERDKFFATLPKKKRGRRQAKVEAKFA